MLICTLGDLLLDVIVRLAQPLAPDADAVAVTHVGPGGQAANVAAWAVTLGAEARFIGKRGDDDAGALAAAGLAQRGVECCGPVVSGRTGVVVSLVAPDGDRTMASDRGVAPELSADELDPAWLAGCDHLHLSGYSLMRSPIDGAALEAARLARAAGARVSVDLSAWPVIRDFGAERLRDEARGAGARCRLRERGRGAGARRAAPRDGLGAQARPPRRALRRARAAGAAGRRGGRHGRRRRPRGRLPRRRAGAGDRHGC